MLVLSRKKDQTLVIGDDIEITVIDIQGDQIRLGVDAPRHVKIFRKELYQEIQEENRKAAKAASSVTPAELSDMLHLGGRTAHAPLVDRPAHAPLGERTAHTPHIVRSPKPHPAPTTQAAATPPVPAPVPAPAPAPASAADRSGDSGSA